MNALSDKDPKFTIRPGDMFLLEGLPFKLDSKKSQGTFLTVRGVMQFDITAAG
jgi:hypothetical protein